MIFCFVSPVINVVFYGLIASADEYRLKFSSEESLTSNLPDVFGQKLLIAPDLYRRFNPPQNAKFLSKITT